MMMMTTAMNNRRSLSLRCLDLDNCVQRNILIWLFGRCNNVERFTPFIPTSQHPDASVE